MAQWQVTSHESGLKLLAFLKTKFPAPNVSLRSLKKGIETGLCALNGRSERFAGTLVGAGDRVSFEMPEKSVAKAPSFDDKCRFLYADSAIVAYNKPPGIASDDKRLLQFMQQQFGSTIELLHRLDRETSGVLLFGRDPTAIQSMLEAFKGREVEKTYFAIVDGVPRQNAGKIENYLAKLNAYQGQSLWGPVANQTGLFASTAWQIEQKGSGAALIKCFPHTGRTHQIRVHLSGMGHPILGDHQYGRSIKSSYKPARILLHSKEIVFVHPLTQKTISVSADLPEDFNQAINVLLKK